MHISFLLSSPSYPPPDIITVPVFITFLLKLVLPQMCVSLSLLYSLLRTKKKKKIVSYHMWFSETCCFYSVLFCKIYSCYNIGCIPLYNRVYLFIFSLMNIQVISIFLVGWEGQLWRFMKMCKRFSRGGFASS